MGLITKFQSWSRQLTPFFLYLLLTATLGPLLFGYHLVRSIVSLTAWKPRGNVQNDALSVVLTKCQAELNAPQEVITCVRKSLGKSESSSSSSLPQCIPMNTTQLGLVSSIFTLGGLIGALAAGSLAARYGRLVVMRYNTALLVVGPIAEALSPSIAVLALGRFISGLGAGVSVVVVPIYISEIAPPSEKGFFGAFTQIMTNMGIFITQVLGYFLSRDSLWRIILAVAGLIGLLQAIGLIAAVDSPKWNAENGHAAQARSDLKKIRGSTVNIEDEASAWGAAEDDGTYLITGPPSPLFPSH